MLWANDRSSYIIEKEEGILMDDKQVGTRLAKKMKLKGITHLIV
jgi:hypothetical protein